MAEIQHEIKIKASPERIIEALNRLEALQSWYGGQVIKENGEWRFEFTDGLKLCWQISTISPQLVIWRCLDGPGDSIGTEVSFALSPADKDRTLVEFVHAGWPGTHGNYRKCNTHWAVLLHHLRQYSETGISSPAFR